MRDLYFTDALTVLYVLILMVSVYLLARLLYFRHRTRSFTTGVLALTVAWALLRALFFLDVLVPTPGAIGQRLLFFLPLCLQFATFALLGLFYAQLVHTREWEQSRLRHRIVALYAVSNLSLVRGAEGPFRPRARC